MALTPATNFQVPEHSIMDAFNKQTYLGNTFTVCSNVFELPTASLETSILYLSNPAANKRALFCNVQRFCATNLANADSATFKVYLNPTLTSANKPIIPINMRPASATVSGAAAAFNPPIAPGTLQVSTVTTVADVAGSLNSKHFNLSSIDSVTNSRSDFYVWFNINSAGVDPKVQGRVGIPITGATNVSANTLATSIRSALNALTNDFVATGSAANVIITLTTVGSVPFASDGGAGGATGFTFANTTAGVSNAGTLLWSYAASGTLASDQLVILDPGKSLLCTAFSTTVDAPISVLLGYYEI